MTRRSPLIGVAALGCRLALATSASVVLRRTDPIRWPPPSRGARSRQESGDPVPKSSFHGGGLVRRDDLWRPVGDDCARQSASASPRGSGRGLQDSSRAREDGPGWSTGARLPARTRQARALLVLTSHSNRISPVFTAAPGLSARCGAARTSRIAGI
jgi:hypothetical protein